MILDNIESFTTKYNIDNIFKKFEKQILVYSRNVTEENGISQFEKDLIKELKYFISDINVDFQNDKKKFLESEKKFINEANRYVNFIFL